MTIKRHLIEKRIAPSAWAGYLINGTVDGMSFDDLVACDAWLESMGFGFPVSCEDSGFHWKHDATRFMPYHSAADCQEYAFIYREKGVDE